MKAYRKKDTFKIDIPYEDPEYEQELYKILDEKVRDCLDILKKYDPQYEMNGYRNVWIVKPNCKLLIRHSHVARKGNQVLQQHLRYC